MKFLHLKKVKRHTGRVWCIWCNCSPFSHPVRLNAEQRESNRCRHSELVQDANLSPKTNFNLTNRCLHLVLMHQESKNDPNMKKSLLISLVKFSLLVSRSYETHAASWTLLLQFLTRLFCNTESLKNPIKSEQGDACKRMIESSVTVCSRWIISITSCTEYLICDVYLQTLQLSEMYFQHKGNTGFYDKQQDFYSCRINPEGREAAELLTCVTGKQQKSQVELMLLEW